MQASVMRYAMPTASGFQVINPISNLTARLTGLMMRTRKRTYMQACKSVFAISFLRRSHLLVHQHLQVRDDFYRFTKRRSEAGDFQVVEGCGVRLGQKPCLSD